MGAVRTRADLTACFDEGLLGLISLGIALFARVGFVVFVVFVTLGNILEIFLVLIQSWQVKDSLSELTKGACSKDNVQRMARSISHASLG